jgi:dTMP kinase
LQNLGYRAQLVSFPRYAETTFGKKVADFLNGRFGQLNEVNPFLAALLYAGDRFESKGWLQSAIDASDVVIFDRYVPSNMAHQGSKLTGADQAELVAWIDQLEFGIYGLPRPDLCILLDIPSEVAQQLIARKAPRDYTEQAADLQESDTRHLQQTREVYLGLARSNNSWHCVPCVQAETLRTADAIAADIWELVRPLLPTQSKK